MYGPADSTAEIVSTPISVIAPRSATIVPRIALSLPSRVAPISRSMIWLGAGLDAAKSSERPNTSRTGRPSLIAAAAASGSGISSLPPNAPPIGAVRTRTRSSGRPRTAAIVWRALKTPCVPDVTDRAPSGSVQASATCVSR